MSSQQVRITDDNRGPLVNLATWITLVVACLATLTKIITKFRKISRPQGDDFIMFAGMLAAIGESIASGKQVEAGLGQHISSLTTSQFESYEKTGYAAQLLYILSLSLPKFAILHFLDTITISNLPRTIRRIIVAVNSVWTVAALIAIASQCASPRPWAIASDQCFNQPAFWGVIGAFDILVDLATIVLPIYILSDLQMPWSRKATIMSAFAARLLLIPLAIIRMVFIKSTSHSNDHPFDDFSTAVITQINMNLSIIFACFIFLRPFMDGLQTGLLASDIHILTSTKKGSGNSGSFGLGTRSKKVRSETKANTESLGPHQRLDTQESLNRVTEVAPGGTHRQDLESMRTSEASGSHIIKFTDSARK